MHAAFVSHTVCASCVLWCSTTGCVCVCGRLLQALAAEVERRQAAVWVPQQGTLDAQLTPHQRQQQLKTARMVLAQRLQQQRQQQVAAGLGLAVEKGGGGFMPDDVDEAWEESVTLKRQRL